MKKPINKKNNNPFTYCFMGIKITETNQTIMKYQYIAQIVWARIASFLVEKTIWENIQMFTKISLYAAFDPSETTTKDMLPIISESKAYEQNVFN